MKMEHDLRKNAEVIRQSKSSWVFFSIISELWHSSQISTGSNHCNTLASGESSISASSLKTAIRNIRTATASWSKEAATCEEPVASDGRDAGLGGAVIAVEMMMSLSVAGVSKQNKNKCLGVLMRLEHRDKGAELLQHEMR